MFTFGVVSDLYEAGRQDDGTPYTAEVFYVIAEDARGNRWGHRSHFNGCSVEICDETGEQYFVDIRPSARARAEKLLARIQQAGGQIDLDYWEEMRPAYGSQAYQDYGMHDDWMEEQMERMGA